MHFSGDRLYRYVSYAISLSCFSKNQSLIYCLMTYGLWDILNLSALTLWTSCSTTLLSLQSFPKQYIWMSIVYIWCRICITKNSTLFSPQLYTKPKFFVTAKYLNTLLACNQCAFPGLELNCDNFIITNNISSRVANTIHTLMNQLIVYMIYSSFCPFRHHYKGCHN